MPKKNETIDIKALFKKKKRRLPKLKVAEAILKSGLTYQQIADRLGMNYYQNLTKLKTADNVSFKTLSALALVLECRIRDLYDE